MLLIYRIELEADYIRLMLLVSASYDPRVAPKALEKLDQFSGDKTYPSTKKRAQLLAQAKVMEEALSRINNSKVCVWFQSNFLVTVGIFLYKIVGI
ncbi:hypothetical protein LWI28_023437 [Acer negundo]|uniref:Uncharacterized protein n=1 Tax=Acer negundo TaxID=4023 RepID=A0AAD5JQH2_ACENE|nr:hypothetical protein LWI28_023437 [Acer negundo]KAK4856113.1 hypothetical protein QYF36_014254 [Acer negundo]